MVCIHVGLTILLHTFQIVQKIIIIIIIYFVQKHVQEKWTDKENKNDKGNGNGKYKCMQ
jgi:uncharacterized membrane protein